MPTAIVSANFSSPREAVFRLLHDYERRLQWDSLLSEAVLLFGETEAKVGAVARCTGKWHHAAIAMETIYISFESPRVAAVRMVNRPFLFERFAASIRHKDCAGGGSILEYRFHFLARPKFLRFMLHPLILWLFHRETKSRLQALERHLANERLPQVPHSKNGR